jgi:hypothetical protein
MEKSTIIFVAALAGAAGLAVLSYKRDAPQTTTTAAHEDPQPFDTNELPPDHPAIGSMDNAMGNAMGEAPRDAVHSDPTEPAALVWKAPAAWSSLPNPNRMRLATYKIPAATGDTDETDLVVARAGGDVKANIARWAAQFTGGPAPIETHKKVHDLDVTTVQIDGTYEGGMMANENAAHEHWSMLGAIVVTPGESYFFKVIGPAATVRAAKKPFDAMLDGIKAP